MVVFDELKTVAKVLQEAGKIDLYEKILDVLQKLLDMQKKISDLESENNNLKEDLKIKENLIYVDNAYWIKVDDKKNDGPFCTRCWDKNKDAIRLHATGQENFRMCPECHNGVYIGHVTNESDERYPPGVPVW